MVSGETIPGILTYAVFGVLRGPSLGNVTTRKGRFKGNFRIGRTSFQQPVVEIQPIPSEFLQRWIIGWDALQHFTLTLDQRARRIRLTAIDSADSVVAPPPSVYSAGVIFDTTGNHVQRVIPGEVAARRGIQVGDVVMSFNDTTVTVANRKELRRRLAQPDSIRLGVQRGTEVQTILLKPEVLVP